jgi:hypothetical protein
MRETSESVCFERIVSVLGEKASGANFQQLICDLQELPKVQEYQHVVHYAFDEHGLEFLSTSICIDSIVFYINTASTRDGFIKPYRLDFPGKIEPFDKKKDVLEKLEAVCISTATLGNGATDCQFTGFHLTFFFNDQTSLIDLVGARLLSQDALCL